MAESEDQKKRLAWLLGFTAHVGVDMTIHPIVEAIAGIYSESKDNQRKHRKCEMHQDVYIWQTLNVGTVGRGEVIDHIRLCSSPNDKGHLHQTIRSLWDGMLKFAYEDLYRKHTPAIDKWHSMFPIIVDKAEESYQWPRFARHVAVNAGIAYPTREEIDLQYINNLLAPDGQRYTYDAIFQKAITHVTELWSAIGKGVSGDPGNHLSILGNWNLDRGLESSGEYVFWTSEDATQSHSA
jgi:hypothetical protein